jgi:hypothetical protein
VFSLLSVCVVVDVVVGRLVVVTTTVVEVDAVVLMVLVLDVVEPFTTTSEAVSLSQLAPTTTPIKTSTAIADRCDRRMAPSSGRCFIGRPDPDPSACKSRPSLSR